MIFDESFDVLASNKKISGKSKYVYMLIVYLTETKGIKKFTHKLIGSYCKEGKDSLKTCLRELKSAGFIIIPDAKNLEYQIELVPIEEVKEKNLSKKQSYASYIDSEAWAKKRKEFIGSFKKEDKKCRKCQAKYEKGFHVHHTSYKSFKNEKFEHLALLCESCHNALHKTKPRKTTIEAWSKSFLA